MWLFSVQAKTRSGSSWKNGAAITLDRYELTFSVNASGMQKDREKMPHNNQPIMGHVTMTSYKDYDKEAKEDME